MHGPSCQGHHHTEDVTGQEKQMAGLMAAMQSALKDIVGDVQERATAAPPQPPTAPKAPAAEAPGGAFPAATHRKLSKFALGRQQQRSGGVAAAAAGPPAAQPAPGEAPAGAAAADDDSRIDAENRQLLAAMSEEQLAAAREEVLQRLPPGVAEFLRRRGAEKAGKAGTAAGSEAAASAGPSAAAAAAAGPPSAPKQPAARPLAPRRQQQQSQLRPAPGSGDGNSQASLAARLRFDVDGAAVGLRAAGSSADVSPAEVAERDPLRCGVLGSEAWVERRPSCPAWLQSCTTGSRTVQFAHLAACACCRQQDGAVGEGYSVQEACLLARSSVPQQRVLALRLLRSVLALSRPSVAASGSGLVPLPAAVAAQLQQEGQREAAAVEWVAVWHHALHAADVVLLLRRSLDDSHSAVVAAAAEAVAVLLGASGPAGAAEETAAETADACTLTGWPVPAMRHMQVRWGVGGETYNCSGETNGIAAERHSAWGIRANWLLAQAHHLPTLTPRPAPRLQRPTASGAWVAAPAAPQLHLDADEEDDGKEEALNEHQLAKVDPLSGGRVNMWSSAVVGHKVGLVVRLSACHSLTVPHCRQMPTVLCAPPPPPVAQACCT